MLSSGNLIQQNKAQGRITDDPKDLCIYVDHCNGTSASVLGQQALSNRLTMDQTLDVRGVFWYVCGHLFLRLNITVRQSRQSGVARATCPD